MCFIRLSGAAAMLLALAGCVEQPVTILPVAPLPPAAEDQCGAAAVSGLVGQDQSALGQVRRNGPWRVLHPDQPVTMDYSAERLNVFLDAQGRITRLTCG